MSFSDTRRLLRLALLAALLLAPAAGGAASADATSADVGHWLDLTADPRLSLRDREYAAHKIMALADSSASALVSALRDKQSGALRRQVAAGLLGRIAPPQAEAALLEAAFDPDPFLAEAAAAALGRLYAKLGDPELFTLLRQGGREKNTIPGGIPEGEDWLALALSQDLAKSRFRSFVMRGLSAKYAGAGLAVPPPLLDWIWNGLADPDRDLRFHAVRAAADSGSSDAPGKIAALLYMENDEAILVEALRAMARMRPPENGEAVERHVGHADPAVSLEALAALAAMGYQGAMFPLRTGGRSVATFVNHPSTPVRRRAIELLAESRNPAALDPLVAALHDRVGINRAAAARALGEMGLTAAVGDISPLLRDGRPEARAAAAVALDRLGVVGVSARVLDDLEGASLPFRRAAAEALGEIRDRRAVPYLAKVLADPDEELACLAAEALGRIGDKTAGKALYATMTASASPVLSEAAGKSLADIFQDDPGTGENSRKAWAERNSLQ